MLGLFMKSMRLRMLKNIPENFNGASAITQENNGMKNKIKHQNGGFVLM